MICLKCGHRNSAGVNYCEKCSAILPKLTHTAEAATASQRVNERFVQLREAADKVLSGAWTHDEYAAFLDSIARILAAKEQEIRDIEIPPEAVEDFRDELEVGFNGIELYNHGIMTMKLYLEDNDPSHLEEGLELAREGNELINDAMRINRDNRKKLEEMYIDTSTMI